MKFFSILGANKRVAELEAEIETLKAASTAPNDAIETLKSENKALVEANDGLTQELAKSNAEAAKVAGLTEKVTTLEASQKDFDAKVEKAASARLLTLTASAGAPPVTAPADPKKDKPEEPKATGLNKTIEAFKAQITASRLANN